MYMKPTKVRVHSHPDTPFHYTFYIIFSRDMTPFSYNFENGMVIKYNKVNYKEVSEVG